MNESEKHQWAAYVAAKIPPSVPGERLQSLTQGALLLLQELEAELDSHPDLVEFARQITDAVSMVGRLQDRLDYPAEDDDEGEEVTFSDHAPG